MAKALRLEVEAARKSKTLVRFTRKLETGRVTGYVAGVGDDWFLLGVINDDILLGGYQAFRFQDIDHLQAPAPNAIFVETVMEKRKFSRPKAVTFDLTSAATILQHAAKKFPLVTVHRELADPGVCHIGRPVKFTAQQVHLLEINPDASWEAEPTAYRLSQITRIDFGGPYEDALALVSK